METQVHMSLSKKKKRLRCTCVDKTGLPMYLLFYAIESCLPYHRMGFEDTLINSTLGWRRVFSLSEKL
jgi:hypothetical protein